MADSPTLSSFFLICTPTKGDKEATFKASLTELGLSGVGASFVPVFTSNEKALEMLNDIKERGLADARAFRFPKEDAVKLLLAAANNGVAFVSLDCSPTEGMVFPIHHGPKLLEDADLAKPKPINTIMNICRFIVTFSEQDSTLEIRPLRFGWPVPVLVPFVLGFPLVMLSVAIFTIANHGIGPSSGGFLASMGLLLLLGCLLVLHAASRRAKLILTPSTLTVRRTEWLLKRSRVWELTQLESIGCSYFTADSKRMDVTTIDRDLLPGEGLALFIKPKSGRTVYLGGWGVRLRMALASINPPRSNKGYSTRAGI